MARPKKVDTATHCRRFEHADDFAQRDPAIPDLINVRDLAEYLNIYHNVAEAFVLRGQIPARRVDYHITVIRCTVADKFIREYQRGIIAPERGRRIRDMRIPDLIGSGEIGNMLGCSDTWARQKYYLQGLIPGITVASQCLMRRVAVKQYLDRHSSRGSRRDT